MHVPDIWLIYTCAYNETVLFQLSHRDHWWLCSTQHQRDCPVAVTMINPVRFLDNFLLCGNERVNWTDAVFLATTAFYAPERNNAVINDYTNKNDWTIT